MSPLAPNIIQRSAPIETWFGVGGGADLLARPNNETELRELLSEHADASVQILGDGANLLIHDAGIDGLTISLEEMNAVQYPENDEAPIVTAQGGANLPKLILGCVQRGLAGVETLAGIPATLGGAIVMNAGGAFGQIADSVRRVHAITRTGQKITLARHEIGFNYRRSGLNDYIITGVELQLERLEPSDQSELRESLKRIMAYKKHSQPMGERSAGCVFKNPTIAHERISAGKLIDEAGCKGLTAGGASVSHVHANFVVTTPDATAQDIIVLMARVRDRVDAHIGVTLEPEVVVWTRQGVEAAL
ncbi:MAG: UDP-N-acetylmuramate dehydrogenase [Phycisphaerales bacterium]|nr:UDP-N-acetylmuramate dehydrogenase [Phycisphaerales bacterium]